MFPTPPAASWVLLLTLILLVVVAVAAKYRADVRREFEFSDERPALDALRRVIDAEEE